VVQVARLRPEVVGDEVGSAVARLELVEFLLQSDDLAACAQRAVEWLGDNAGVEQAICAAVVTDASRMHGVAGQGVSSARTGEFVVDLADLDHPLTVAAAAAGPSYFSAHDQRLLTPISGSSFHNLPLRSRALNGGTSVGLLLVSGRGRVPGPDVRWCAELLGEKLARLRARQLLSDAEGRFGRERRLLYSIINAVTDPIMLTDTEGKLIIANARAEKLFSAPDDATEGRRRAVALNNMLFSATLSSGSMGEGARLRELPLVDPIDGSDLLFEHLVSVVRDPREGSCVVSILRNVTDLGRAKEQLEENYRKLRLAEAEVRGERHRLELIIDSVADPILVTDPAGDIVLMNTPAETLFTVGPNQSDAVQRRVRANDAHFSSFVSNLLFSGSQERWRGEIGLVDPQVGKAMPVEAIAGKMLSETGELTAVVTILHDRTEAQENARLYDQVKRASGELQAKVQDATAELAEQNELLRRQAIELEQASALKSQFLANMSHEFRTPLNAILGYTSMLVQGVAGSLSAHQKKGMNRVDSNARHLLALINDILDITRIEAGRMPLHLSDFDLKDLLAEVMSELEPIIARSKITVSVQLSNRLPEMRSDRKKVKQILVNLLSNALKFTPRGTISIRADMRARRVEVAVADTGIGISPADQEKVFEDFRQLDSSPARAHGGTGLGLSICRRLASMLGGRITLQSAPGQGSTFTLHLPCRLRRK
jgi:PAS domain S-box-containing protein